MSDAVLVVDDSLTVRMDLDEALRDAGLVVTSCATLAEARDAMARERFGVIVLDLLFPDGDGLDLLRAIRADPRTSTTPVILLSTEAEVGDRLRGREMGADDYVGKPYDRGYVAARARELSRRDDGAARTERPLVLVIDDSVTFRETLREALLAEGNDVAIARDGEEGLRLAASLRPAAIVVDAVMPGIHGSTVVRRIRLDGALRKIPCVLLTASEGPGAELRALEAGADAFVRKEEDVAVILARIGAAMRSASESAGRVVAASLLGPKKLLAVDGDGKTRERIADAFREQGYDVILARSGEEALEILPVQPADCVLLALAMPGLGGEETCRRIKGARSTRDIPVMMLVGGGDRAATMRAFAAGADDVIDASTEQGVFEARVLAQVRRKQLEDESRVAREERLRAALEAAEARAARELADTRAKLLDDLARKNKELEAFSYSVSHDLRAPLRSIDGFSRALLEDYADALAPKAKEYLDRVCAAAKRMGELIDDLLQLSRLSRAQMRVAPVDLSAVAEEVVVALRRSSPERVVRVSIEPNVAAEGDRGLLKVVLENLLGNAWKFTAKRESPTISFGTEHDGDGVVYFVRDDGAGFDARYAARLFAPFQRLHGEAEFPGTGIGLATVARIVDRHGGRIWADGAVGKGAVMRFTLGRAQADGGRSR